MTESSIDPRIIGQDAVFVDEEIEEVSRVSVSIGWSDSVSIRDSKRAFHHQRCKKSDGNLEMSTDRSQGERHNL